MEFQTRENHVPIFKLVQTTWVYVIALPGRAVSTRPTFAGARVVAFVFFVIIIVVVDLVVIVVDDGFVVFALDDVESAPASRRTDGGGRPRVSFGTAGRAARPS